MLVIGGSTKLAGALIGTPVFMVVHHVASSINPYHWLFVIGILLIATVLYAPNGLVERMAARIGASRAASSLPRPDLPRATDAAASRLALEEARRG
jgi:hypothetical protein